MEDATKALLMAASVLIGILILTMGVYLYTTIGSYVRQSQEEIEAEAINKFNIQFYNYELDKEEVFSFQDIVTIANTAYENNYGYEFSNVKFKDDGSAIIKPLPNDVQNAIDNEGNNDYVQVVVKQNPGTINLEMYAGDSKALSKILEKNYQNKYKCSGVFTSDFTKKVYKITFEKLN